MPDKDQQEYIIASEHIRHQDTACFAHMTLFATITGALVAFRYSTFPPERIYLAGLAGIAGMLTSVTFWVNMEIYMYRFHVFLERAASLEKPSLNFSLYSSMLEGSRKFRPGSWSWRSLFAAVTAFWTYDVKEQLLPLCPIPSWLVAASLAVLIQLAVFLGRCNRRDATAPWWA